MGKIAKNLTELIGNTPLLELANYGKENSLYAKLVAKLEYFNPLGCIKDRIGYAMIADAEEKGLIKKETVLIEPISGNTGIALAFISAAKGYKLILTMPETTDAELRNSLEALGAELVLTPGSEKMEGAIKRAKELAAETPNSFMPSNSANDANPSTRRKALAWEVWNDNDGKVDIFVGGVGTGGTIIGVAEVLKGKNPNIKIVAVKPALPSVDTGAVPGIFNSGIFDEIIPVQDEQARETSRKLAKTEGLMVGISSGATAYAATQLAKRPENEGKTIVVIFPDIGERYLSKTLFEK